MKIKPLAAMLSMAWMGTTAWADVTIGVSLPLTGPAASLGKPVQNQMNLWPKKIGGETIKLLILDDATDPTNGVKNAKKLTSEDKVDVLLGSVATPVAVAMVDVALETKTPQLAISPIGLPAGKDAWSFRLPQSNDVMGHAIVQNMKKKGVKTVGFLGYSDAYGEQWLKAFSPLAEKAGIKLVATERFARSDISVTGQALKIISAKPDAVLIVASGSGAGMPQKAIGERGYKGLMYQTHAAATKDFIKAGGRDTEGALVVSGPVIAPDQLPDAHPSKKLALDFVKKYDAAYGVGSHNQFAGHAYDALIVLEKAIPLALKKAKPGTPQFREALKTAFETMGKTYLAHGTLNWTASDHWGYTLDTGVMVRVQQGEWKLEK